jgi:hypothetical protein
MYIQIVVMARFITSYQSLLNPYFPVGNLEYNIYLAKKFKKNEDFKRNPLKFIFL